MVLMLSDFSFLFFSKFVELLLCLGILHFGMLSSLSIEGLGFASRLHFWLGCVDILTLLKKINTM